MRMLWVHADTTTFLHLSSRRGRVRNKGILCMRADSSEWICSKRGIRTNQWLTKPLGFPVSAKIETTTTKKTADRLVFKDGKKKNAQGTPSL
jgi:hypothetical protein